MATQFTQPEINPPEVARVLPVQVPAKQATMRLRELCWWCVLMTTVGALNIVHNGGPRIWNDSYQYLSAAENLRDHGEAATSLVFFDSERARGHIPAPITTFPPGYSTTIAAVATAFKCSLEHAALAVSLASVLAVIPLLWLAANLLAFPLPVLRLCLFLWIFSSDTAVFATADTSEGLFTALAFAGILLLAWYERAGAEQKHWQVVAAFLLIGLAYWVRYAALFLFAGLLLYAVFALKRKWSSWPIWLLSAGLCAFVIASGMLREILIAGDWKGGRMPIVHNPPLLVLRELLVIAYNLVFATGHVRLDLLVLLGLMGVLALLVLFGRIVFFSRRPRQAEERQYLSRIVRPLTLLSLCVLVYSAALVYLGLFTFIAFGVRMFFPLLPVFLILFGIAFSLAWPRASEVKPAVTAAVMAVFLSGYAAGHIRAMWESVEPADHELVARALAAPMQNGQQLRSWIEANIPQTSAIVAVDGQATGYLLHRKTIGLPERRHSTTEWNEEQLRHVMEMYGARYLIVYPKPTPGAAQVQSESRFLNELTRGDHPVWLAPVARNANAEVFALQP